MATILEQSATATTLTVPVAALREALARVSRVLMTRTSPLPILACVRLTADADAITLDATNIDAYVRTRFSREAAPSFADPDALRVAVPAQRLAAVLQYATAETATLTVRDGAGRKLDIRIGRARYELAGVDPDEMPVLRGADDPMDPDASRIPAGVLQRAIKRVQHAASTADVPARLVMNSVHLEPAPEAEGSDGALGALDVIALDVPKSARIRLVLPGIAGALGDGAIVPSAAAAVLTQVFDADELIACAARDGMFRVVSDRTVCVACCIAGPYPPWRRVVRETSPFTVVVERAVLLAAVERVMIAAEDEKGWRHVGLAFAGAADEGTLRLWAASQTGSAVDVIACEVPAGGELTLCVNAAHLRDVLARTHDGRQVRLEMEGERRNVQITDPADPGVFAMISTINMSNAPAAPGGV